MSDKSDVGMGTVEAVGGEGMLDSCRSQALARRRCDFLFDSHRQRQLSIPGSSASGASTV